MSVQLRPNTVHIKVNKEYLIHTKNGGVQYSTERHNFFLVNLE